MSRARHHIASKIADLACRARYRPWSRIDDKRLAELYSQDASRKSIAHALGRTESSVSGRLIKLGLSQRRTAGAPLSLAPTQTTHSAIDRFLQRHPAP
jgi:hypothetical protein